MKGRNAMIFDKPEYIERVKITTDDTKTTVYKIAIGQLQAAAITVTGVVDNADTTKSGQFLSTAGFNRASGGNVAIVGNQHDIVADYTAGCAAAITIEANTTTQTVDICVTGETSETFTWKLGISCRKV